MEKITGLMADDEAAREIVITRLLNAPRELVFRVWTEPEHIIQWWGPKGFTNTTHKMDVRPGGVWSSVMHGPNNMDFNNLIVYKEIVKPEKLVYTHGSESDPDQFIATITFEEREGNKTFLTMHSLFKSAALRDMVIKEYGAIEGGNQTVDRLEEHLAKIATGKAEILVTRTIHAPRSLVFDAFTKPEHLVHWWGSNNCRLHVCEVDLRTGGAYRFIMGTPPEHEYLVSGIYHEISAPERLVFSCGLENEDKNHKAMWCVTFVEENGATKLTIHQVVYDLEDARHDAEKGLNESLDMLTGYLAGIDA
jgi:uncharacterized protein YndB with AHSA1/START domain